MLQYATVLFLVFSFFFSSRRRHTRCSRDWSSDVCSSEIVSASYYYYDVLLLSKMAAILGNSSDAQAYSQLATEIKEAFNKTFFNSNSGVYSNGTQTANALPLFLDLVPEKQRGEVVSRLTNDIVYTHDTHVTTGFIGVKYLLPVLTRFRHSDVAYDLAVQDTYPSWGYMVRRGATTLWELWQETTGPAMNSHNHAMFGSVGAWFYQALGGINLGEDGAGYRHIRIAPQIVDDRSWVSASVESVRGTVRSEERRVGKECR